jgi:aminoethylphosphonate catabolism LysR family transcriptional regulator
MDPNLIWNKPRAFSMPVSHAQLKAFHAVATHGGFSRAAEKLFLTQPAVSDQVRRLEEYYGVLLFYRNKRTVRMTALGKRLLALTRRLFAVEAEADELLSCHRALAEGNLTFAVDSPIHILPYLARFNEAWPGIALKLVTSNTQRSMERLLTYQADLAIVGEKTDDERFQSILLSDAPLVAFVSASHAWAERAEISLRDLARMPIVLREEGSTTRALIEAEMRAAGLELFHIIEAQGREAVNEIVAAGIGVGIVSKAEAGRDGHIRVIPIVDCQAHMHESLICLREQSSRRIIQTFMDLVRRQRAEAPEAGHAQKKEQAPAFTHFFRGDGGAEPGLRV